MTLKDLNTIRCYIFESYIFVTCLRLILYVFIRLFFHYDNHLICFAIIDHHHLFYLLTKSQNRQYAILYDA